MLSSIEHERSGLLQKRSCFECGVLRAVASRLTVTVIEFTKSFFE